MTKCFPLLLADDVSTVPFTTNADGGFTDVKGLLRIEESVLIVDFEIADSITAPSEGHF